MYVTFNISLTLSFSLPLTQISIKLIQTLEILDTSNIAPRHTFFLKEARPQFIAVTHNVSSITDLEEYWIKLYHICIATPIIIGTLLKYVHCYCYYCC